jgi:hypothetical protein
MAEASNANLPITDIFLDHLNKSNGDSDLTSIVEGEEIKDKNQLSRKITNPSLIVLKKKPESK